LPESVWKKPVICIFKERDEKPEIDPFVVVKAKEIAIARSKDGKTTGRILDFFTLMGDADYLSTAKGAVDHYVMCWFDDNEPDQTKDLRRLRGVTFSEKVSYVLNDSGKRTYHATFKAQHAKLE
jgi:hypothetical protein